MQRARNWWWYIDRIADYEAHMHAISRTILTEKTLFQEVGIVESPVYGKILLLDGDMQSAQADEFIYHEALVHPALVTHPAPRKVLILGGGEGATLREVARHQDVEKIYMLDIDEQLVEICKKHLPEWSQGAFNDPRLELIITDAHKWLHENNLTFDVIISDLTEPLPFSPSYDLFCFEFFKMIKGKLNSPGIYALQASRGDYKNIQVHSTIFKTLCEVFSKVRSALERVPSYDLNWAFINASDEIDPLEFDCESIDKAIKNKIAAELQFYDGETHKRIFSLPKCFRTARALQGKIVKKGEAPPLVESPVYLL